MTLTFDFGVALVASAYSTCLSPLWLWSDSWLRPFVSRVLSCAMRVSLWNLQFPPSGKIKQMQSLAVPRGHIWVDMVGCMVPLHACCSKLFLTGPQQFSFRVASEAAQLPSEKKKKKKSYLSYNFEATISSPLSVCLMYSDDFLKWMKKTFLGIRMNLQIQ